MENVLLLNPISQNSLADGVVPHNQPIQHVKSSIYCFIAQAYTQ